MSDGLFNGPLGLGFVLAVGDQASASLDKIRGKMAEVEGQGGQMTSAFDRTFSGFKAGVAAMGVGLGTLAGAFRAADAGGKFEYALASLGLVSGATAEELRRMEEAAMAAGASSAFSPTQAIEGMRELAAQGLTAAEAMQVLQPTLDFAAGSLGELGIGESAGLAAQAMKAFGVETQNAGLALDQMLKVGNLSAIAPKDLPLALGTAARGAQALGQNLETTLVALGLVKNVMPRVESAATATSVAMERLADPKNKKDLQALGVQVWDQSGKARGFLDILDQLQRKLGGMTKEKQTGLLMDIFGREGMGGIQAMLEQITNGVKTASGEMVRGADAIRYLQGEIANAKGTSKEFADKLLQTFAGQKQALSAASETLAIAIGKPFAAALAPVVGAVRSMIAGVAKWIEAIPAPVKETIAKVIAMAGAVTAVVGGFLMAKAAIATFGAAVATIFAPMLPGILMVGAAVGGVMLMIKAFQVNAEQTGGGILGVFSKVGLAARALFQVFSTGEFSGDVLKQLEAGNEGIESFVVRLYVLWGRLEEFGRGVALGFRQGMETVAPAFTRVGEALGFLLESFGIVNRSVDENKRAFGEAGASGVEIGQILSRLAGTLANGLTIAILATKGAIDFIRVAWDAFGGRLVAVWEIFKGLAQFLMGFFTGDWKMMWMGAIDVAFGAIKFLLDKILTIPKVLSRVVDAVGGTFGIDVGSTEALKDLEKFALDGLHNMKADLKDSVGFLMGPSPEQTRASAAAVQKQREDQNFNAALQVATLGLLPGLSLPSTAATAAAPAPVGMLPAVAAAADSASRAPLPAVQFATPAAPAAAAPARPVAPTPQDITMITRTYLDGQTLLESIEKRRNEAEARAFTISLDTYAVGQ